MARSVQPTISKVSPPRSNAVKRSCLCASSHGHIYLSGPKQAERPSHVYLSSLRRTHLSEDIRRAPTIECAFRLFGNANQSVGRTTYSIERAKIAVHHVEKVRRREDFCCLLQDSCHQLLGSKSKIFGRGAGSGGGHLRLFECLNFEKTRIQHVPSTPR